MRNLLKSKILDICQNDSSYLMSLENVNGIGLGYKYINNCKTSELCLHVLVQNKISAKYLTKNNIIPTYYKGIKTDIIKLKQPKACGEPLSSKIRPVEGGYGISCNNHSGTIGCIVTKQIGKRVLYYILSNNHVLVGVNEVPLGASIIQPSFKDGGTLESDKIAILNDFIRIQFKNDDGSDAINYVDCAIARIFKPENISDRIAEIEKIKGIAEAIEGEKIKKVGKITGRTEGSIKTIGAILKIDMGKNIAIFADQIIADIECQAGDSGSAILNEEDKIVGLLCAGISNDGDKTYTIGIINNISRVLDSFKVKIFQKDQ